MPPNPKPLSAALRGISACLLSQGCAVFKTRNAEESILIDEEQASNPEVGGSC